MNDTGTTSTQSHGWAQFCAICLTPVLAATINPLLFISLTPCSVDTLKDFVYREVASSVKEQQAGEISFKRCNSRRRRHCTEVIRTGSK
jgi:hypothetical protein